MIALETWAFTSYAGALGLDDAALRAGAQTSLGVLAESALWAADGTAGYLPRRALAKSESAGEGRSHALLSRRACPPASAAVGRIRGSPVDTCAVTTGRGTTAADVPALAAVLWVAAPVDTVALTLDPPRRAVLAAWGLALRRGPGNSRDGGQHATHEGAAHDLQRLAPRDSAARQPLGQLVKGGSDTCARPGVCAFGPTHFRHQASPFLLRISLSFPRNSCSIPPVEDRCITQMNYLLELSLQTSENSASTTFVNKG